MLELAQTLAVALVLALQLKLLREQGAQRRGAEDIGEELRQLKTSLRPRARRNVRFEDEREDDTPRER